MTKLIRPRMHGRRGYTMAEVMVVILLIGVLGALAAPKVSGMFQTSQPKRVLDQLTQDMSLARMRAIRSGRPATVSSTGTSAYVVTVQNNTGGSDVIRRVDVDRDNKGVTISTFTVTFDGRELAVPVGAAEVAAHDQRVVFDPVHEAQHCNISTPKVTPVPRAASVCD